MPYKTALVYTYDCGDFGKNLEDCLVKADYAGFAARRAQVAPARQAARHRHFQHGRGLECRADRARRAALRSDRHGDRSRSARTITARATQTAFRQIIADKLGIAPDRVRFKFGDTDQVAIGTGTFGSRSMIAAAPRCCIAADKIVAKGTKIAAHLMEAGEHDIVFEDGKFVVAGTDKSVDLVDGRARLPSCRQSCPKGMEPGLFETGTFDGGERTYPNGCHISEVEIDEDDRRGRARALHRGRRRRPHDQPAAGRRPVARRHRPGRRPGADGEHRLRRIRASSCPARSWTTRCRARTISAPSSSARTRCRPRPTRSASRAPAKSGTVGALPSVMNAVNDALAAHRRALRADAGDAGEGLARAACRGPMSAGGKHHILIAGGGIGGLAAALALLDRGHDVDVYEQAPDLKEVGAGVQISPNGNRALHALGVFEAMQRLSCNTVGQGSPAVEHRQDLEAVRPRHRGDRALRLSLCHGLPPGPSAGARRRGAGEEARRDPSRPPRRRLQRSEGGRVTLDFDGRLEGRGRCADRRRRRPFRDPPRACSAATARASSA